MLINKVDGRWKELLIPINSILNPENYLFLRKKTGLCYFLPHLGYGIIFESEEDFKEYINDHKSSMGPVEDYECIPFSQAKYTELDEIAFISKVTDSERYLYFSIVIDNINTDINYNDMHSFLENFDKAYFINNKCVNIEDFKILCIQIRNKWLYSVCPLLDDSALAAVCYYLDNHADIIGM